MTMPDFKHRLRVAIAQNPDYRNSFAALSRDIGKSPNYVSNLLNNQKTVDPSVTVCRRLSECLDVPITYLAGLTDEFTITGDKLGAGTVGILAEKILDDLTRSVRQSFDGYERRPALDDLIAWWHRNGGVLPEHSAVLESVDLHEKPDVTDEVLKPYHLGHNSLASKVLGTSDIDVLRRFLNQFDRKTMEMYLAGYRKLEGAEFPVTIEAIEAKHPSSGVAVELTYRRILMPVKTQCGKDLVLNYSTLIR